MPIAINRTGIVFGLFAFISCCTAFAQEKVDTVNIRPFERYWTQPRIVPKVGFAVQESGFGELGIQLHQIYVHPLSLASAGPYLTIDAMVQTDATIIGPKIGYELAAGLLGFATDVTYYSDLNKRHLWTLTPKAGLTLFGYVNLFYGYNFFLSDERFTSISNHRFSLTFNLNPDYHRIKDAKKSVRSARRAHKRLMHG